MSTTDPQQLAGVVCHAYGHYVNSKAYWRDDRRARRRSHEAFMQCVRSDLKRFRDYVISALRIMERDASPAEALADVLHWLRQRLAYAKADLAAWMKDGMTQWESRYYGRAIEVAECLVEVVHLSA